MCHNLSMRPFQPSTTASTATCLALCIFFSAMLPISSQTTDGNGGNSSNSTSVSVVKTTLQQKSVFSLSELTRKMVLRGTRHAMSMSSSIGGKVIPLENKKPLKEYPGSSTDSSWYIDPYESYSFTAFRESYDYPFDFGNGVKKNLRIVPVRMFNGSPDAPKGGYRDNVLLDLAYAGEVEIEGVRYVVEVVQGASPDFKDRLKYPGFFNDPDVNILLYRTDNNELVGGIGRLKKINGKWYEFLSNASGEELNINRLTASGRIRINTGPFPQVDFAFTSGRFESPAGWAISLADLDFGDKEGVELPAGNYTFSEIFVKNNGQTMQFVWHPSFGKSHGSISVPVGGVVEMKIGINAEIELGLDPRYSKPVNDFYCEEWLKFRIFDKDLGAAVVALDTKPYVSDYTNSRGDKLSVKWSTKPCGWDGMWWFISEARDFSSSGDPILAIDPTPPVVEDTRKVTMSCDFKGLFGKVSKTMEMKVRNETYRLHGKFYDFDDPLQDFPDFDNLAPDLELPEARMGSQANAPWQGLPDSMADTFAARYEFGFAPNIPAGTENLENYVYRYQLDMILAGGAARVYVDDKLVMDHKNFDNTPSVFTTADLTGKGDAYRRIRVEYYHNSGTATLSLKSRGLVPLFGTVITFHNQFDPDHYDPRYGNRLVAINPVYIPATINYTTGWKGGETFVLRGSATSPDGIAKVEYFVDGVRVATTDGPDVNATLTSVNLDSKVVLRAVNKYGFGTLREVSVEGESLEEWMERYGLTDPDADADGDGVSNRNEFLAGTIPLPPPPFEVQSLKITENKLSLNWLGDKTGSKLVDSYQVEFSKDLKNWKPQGASIFLRGNGTYAFETSTKDLGSPVFYRVVPGEDTAIVGMNRLVCPANSDTLVSVPFMKAPLKATGKLGTSPAVSGNSATLTPAQTPSWSPDELSNNYYLRFTSGELAGRWYDISGNQASLLTIDLNGENVTGLSVGDSFVIVEYWTLDSLFPPGNQTTFHVSEGTMTYQQESKILIPNTSDSGIDLAAKAVYFLTEEGWKKSSPGYPASGGTILPPGQPFIVRHPAGVAATEFAPFGEVLKSRDAVWLARSQAAPQDNSVALFRPLDVALESSGLVDSAFEPSTSDEIRKDELLVFDNNTVGFNKPPSTIYYKIGDNWYREDAESSTQASSADLKASGGMIIRKAKGSDNSTIWNNEPTY